MALSSMRVWLRQHRKYLRKEIKR